MNAIAGYIIFKRLDSILHLYLKENHPILKEEVEVITLQRYENEKPYTITHIKQKGLKTFCGTSYTPKNIIHTQTMTVEEFIKSAIERYKEIKDLSLWKYNISNRFCVMCVKKLLISMNVFNKLSL